jgi:nitrite reductase/ring-hydroxylating ferredoxin subunit
MTRKVTLLAAKNLPPGEAAEVVADGQIFAVYNIDGAFRVIDGICAHAGGPLGKGALNGTIVTCPWHGWQYDVSTGRNCLTASICQQTYPVQVEDGQVVIELTN